MAYGATNPDGEDFRSRYPTETAGGMPDYLANAAATNLAATDAGISRFNAVSRMNPSPGVGAVGSTPQTDATNLSVAAAMDRGDAFDRSITSASTTTSPSLSDAHLENIMERRTQLASQKQELMNTLAATRMDDTKRRANLLNTWHSLDTEDNNLLHEHQLVTTDAAKTAHENLVRQTAISASNGLAKVINGIAGINEPMGSDAHTLAALKILGDTSDPDIAAARGHPGFDKILGPYAEQAKKSALTADRIKEAVANYQTATGSAPESVEVTAGGGINLRGGSVGAGGKGKLSNLVESDLAKAGVSPEDFANRANVRRGMVANGNFTNDYAGAATGSQVGFDIGGKTYHMPAEDFDRASNVHPAAATPAPAASATPDITKNAYDNLKSGEPYFFGGKQYKKK